MQDGNEDRASEGKERLGTAEKNSRPQRAGEAATTRFGMEEGDNLDIPATGGPVADEERSDN